LIITTCCIEYHYYAIDVSKIQFLVADLNFNVSFLQYFGQGCFQTRDLARSSHWHFKFNALPFPEMHRYAITVFKQEMVMKFKRVIFTTVAVLILNACGGGDGGDGGTTYNYTVTSTTWFTGGQQVAVVRFGISGSCSNITGVTSGLTRVGAGTVSTPGAVSFSFTTGITPPFMESVYIDNNASENLDNGDRVWGDNPNDFMGVCFDAIAVNQTLDWEDFAAQLQARTGSSVPSILYTGPPQAFRGEAGSEPELMIDNTIIVDGDGYDSMQW